MKIFSFEMKFQSCEKKKKVDIASNKELINAPSIMYKRKLLVTFPSFSQNNKKEELLKVSFQCNLTLHEYDNTI